MVEKNSFSTRGGEIGFSVKYEDDTEINETTTSWDGISKTKRIKELSIIHLKFKHAFVTLKNYEWFFFENEATGTDKGILFHTAKILGGVNPDQGAIELRFEFSSDSIVPSVEKREYSWDFWNKNIKRRTSTMRQGVNGSKIIQLNQNIL